VTIAEPIPTPTEPPRGRRRANRTAIAAAVVLVFVGALVLASCDDSANAPTANRPTPTTDVVHDTVDDTAIEVAQGFVEAYGAFDADRAISYLAKDADVRGLITEYNEEAAGTLEQLPLVLAWLEATGHQQMLDSCVEQSSSAAGIAVRCTYDFHAMSSDELGLGPYRGSYFDLTVRDGEVVRATGNVEISEFSPQMWEPFVDWMDANHPADADVMYIPTRNGARFTQESFRLWEQHIREHVAAKAAEG
jgi:hypothetical protein